MRRRFDGTPASVGASRRFAAEAIADLPDEVRAAVILMVSELATNAVLHATGAYEVSIDRGSDRVDVSVTDFGGAMPVVRTPNTRDPHGRGLQVVGELSDVWGVEDGAYGKSVWFSLDVGGELRGLADNGVP